MTLSYTTTTTTYPVIDLYQSIIANFLINNQTEQDLIQNTDTSDTALALLIDADPTNNPDSSDLVPQPNSLISIMIEQQQPNMEIEHALTSTEDNNYEETWLIDTVCERPVQKRISYSQALVRNLPEKTRKTPNSYYNSDKKKE